MKIRTLLPKDAARENSAGVEIFKHALDGELYYKDKLNQLIPLDTTSTSESLAATLAVGNTTGANDISVNTGQKITSPLGSNIYFDAIGQSAIGIVTSGGAGLEAREFSEYISLKDTSGNMELSLNPTNDVRLANYELGGIIELASEITKINTYTATLPSIELISTSVNSGTLSHIALTADRTWDLPDASGTVALFSDIPPSPTLAVTLGHGNTTGGTDIAVTNGDTVSFNSAAWELGYNQFAFGEYGWKRPAFTGIEYFVIGSNLTDDYFLYSGTGISLAIPVAGGGGSASLANSGVQAATSGGGFTISTAGLTGTRTFTLPDDVGSHEILTATSVTLNTVLNGGNSTGAFNMTISDDLGANLNWSTAGSNCFIDVPSNPASIRTWTMPDASGTVALLSDIPAGAGDNIYNTNGTLTGARTVAGGTNPLTINNLDFFKVEMDDTFTIDQVGGGTLVEVSSGEFSANIAYSGRGLTLNNPSAAQQTITFKDLGGTNFDGTLQNADLSAARTWTLPDATGTIALTSDITGGFTLDDAANIVLNTTTGTKIGTATSQKLGFFNATPVVQQTALPTALTDLTVTAPTVADYTLQDMTNTSPWGFADGEEARTFTTVVVNNQDRINDLETKLQALGLIA